MSESSSYAIHATLPVNYQTAIEQVTVALKAEGFGVLTEIDVKTTFKKKLDVDFRPYVILGACNPNLAHQALNAELDVGLLLPCNVIVYAGDAGTTEISIIDPNAMLSVGASPKLQAVADVAREKLLRVADSLNAGN